jgi:hypothetical protein
MCAVSVLSYVCVVAVTVCISILSKAVVLTLASAQRGHESLSAHTLAAAYNVTAYTVTMRSVHTASLRIFSNAFSLFSYYYSNYCCPYLHCLIYCTSTGRHHADPLPDHHCRGQLWLRLLS